MAGHTTTDLDRALAPELMRLRARLIQAGLLPDAADVELDRNRHRFALMGDGSVRVVADGTGALYPLEEGDAFGTFVAERIARADPRDLAGPVERYDPVAEGRRLAREQRGGGDGNTSLAFR